MVSRWFPNPPPSDWFGVDRVEAQPNDDPLTHSQSGSHRDIGLIGYISCGQLPLLPVTDFRRRPSDTFRTLWEAIRQHGWRTFALISLWGLERFSECRSESLLYCVHNERNTHPHTLCYTYTHTHTHTHTHTRARAHTHTHTHNTLRLPSPINRTPGEQEGENQIQSGYWFEGVCACVCVLLCLHRHTQQHVKAHFCLKQPYKYFYLKDYQQLVRLQLESSLSPRCSGTAIVTSLSNVLQDTVWVKPRLTCSNTGFAEYQYYYKTSRWGPHLQKSTLVS